MTGTVDPVALAAESISANDLAARLESNGLGDGYARGLGHPDIFALADQLFAVRGEAQPVTARPGPRSARRQPGATSRVPAAVLRAVVLGLGMGICILALPGGSALLTVAVAGVVSWFAAQLSGAAVWADIGLGTTDRVAATVRPIALVWLIVAAVAALATASTAPFVWGLWGVTAGILLPSAALARLALAMVILTAPALVLTLVAGPALGSLAATIGVLTTAIAAATRVAPRSRAELRAFRWLPRPALRVPLAQAFLQVAAQVGCFLALMFALAPAARAGIGFGCLVAAVLSDPLLTWLEDSTAGLARQARSGRWLGVRLIAGSLTVAVALAGVAGAVAYAWPAPDHFRWQAALVTAIVTLVGLSVSAPLRAGFGRSATRTVLVAAIPGLIVSVGLQFDAVPLIPALIGGLVVVGVLALVALTQALNSPNRW